MRKQLKKSLALLLLLSVLFMYVPLSLAAAGGKGDLTLQQKAAIEAIAEYTTGSTDWVAMMLQQYCYEPSVAPSTWQHYPAVRKLAIAYEAAEAAIPDIGGDMLLALLSKALAQRYEAVRQEPSLVKYLKMKVTTGGCLEFRNVEKRVFLSGLPLDVSEAIKTIAEYSTPGPLSPRAITRTILKESREFNEDDADGFLCQSVTNADAYQRALSFVPRQQQGAVVKELVGRLIAHNEAAQYELAFKPFLPEKAADVSFALATRPRTVEPRQDFESDYSRLNQRLPGSQLTTPSPEPTPFTNAYPYGSSGIGMQPTNTQPPVFDRPWMTMTPLPERPPLPRQPERPLRQGVFGGERSGTPPPRQRENITVPSPRPPVLIVAPNINPPARERTTPPSRRAPLSINKSCP